LVYNNRHRSHISSNIVKSRLVYFGYTFNCFFALSMRDLYFIGLLIGYHQNICFHKTNKNDKSELISWPYVYTAFFSISNIWPIFVILLVHLPFILLLYTNGYIVDVVVVYPWNHRWCCCWIPIEPSTLSCCYPNTTWK